MGLDLEQVLKDNFSYSQFREGQKEIIESVLTKHDTLAILSTGTGKSLCYQLPGYIFKDKIIIVSPLLSLMQDQVEQMKSRGEKRVVALNSFLSTAEREMVLRNINAFKFIYISPEMLQSHFIIRIMKSLKISLLVVDEAHCISQWGYDFRPDYLELGHIRKMLGNPPILALTATAREEVKQDIVTTLDMRDVQEFSYPIDRPNIAIKVDYLKDFQEKAHSLIEYVKFLQPPGIIYFSSKKLADEWADILNRDNIVTAAAYHAGMDQEQRILLQQQFIFNEIQVICATSAFGMGVNKNDIRYIIHFHPPVDIESYMQEIGRAGRDGLSSLAIMLYSQDDILLQRQLISYELPTENQISDFRVLMQTYEVKKGNRVHGDTKRIPQPVEGYSETAWRLLWKFYWQIQNKKFFQVKMTELLSNRLKWKNNRLQEMTNWIYKTGCRRENILRYFNESKKMNIDQCCDQCGLDLVHYKRKETKLIKKNSMDWRKRLNDIFNKR